jgi:hypothetical protein
VEVRDLPFGSDCNRVNSLSQLEAELPARLAHGPRVLKQHRGHSGLGVWRIEQLGAERTPETQAGTRATRTLRPVVGKPTPKCSTTTYSVPLTPRRRPNLHAFCQLFSTGWQNANCPELATRGTPTCLHPTANLDGEESELHPREQMSCLLVERGQKVRSW